MAPKFKFTREEIINSALEVTRKEGISALTARRLASELGSSAKPIFGLFQSMDEVKTEVLKKADEIYREYLSREMSNDNYPPYKASGIGYIRFASEEKELFKLLFMRDRSRENIADESDSLKPLIEIIKKQLGLDEGKAYLFHLELWLFVHGIATMLATDYLDWDMEFVSNALTDAYQGLKSRFSGE